MRTKRSSAPLWGVDAPNKFAVATMPNKGSKTTKERALTTSGVMHCMPGTLG